MKTEYAYSITLLPNEAGAFSVLRQCVTTKGFLDESKTAVYSGSRSECERFIYTAEDKNKVR